MKAVLSQQECDAASQRSDLYGDCFQLRSMYLEELLPGPYPTSEEKSIGLSDTESGILLLYLASIAGMASCGDKLLTLAPSRRRDFKEQAAEPFAAQWPGIVVRISAERTPNFHRLMEAAERARQLVSLVLEGA